jgi:Methyl-accepting chemotaxis protein
MSSNNELSRRLKFLKVNAETSSSLLELKPLLAKRLPIALEKFYKHLNEFPEVSEFFSTPDRQKHAADRQLDHWMAILNGKFDDAYMESAKTIGRVHAKIGLEPKWYIAGYNHLISDILPAITGYAFSKYGKGTKAFEKAESLQSAFLTAAMLDIEICSSVYIEDTMNSDRNAALAELANQLETDVGGIAAAVAAASTELEQTARAMSDIAERTQSRSVSVSAAMEQSTTNVASVANSADEMGQSISEISKQAAHASKIASSAVSTAQMTNETMDRLSKSTTKIGEIISLISDIAAQTNLLALNATIESARAGEAGKGFAVVASEVKSLATQTAKATEDISKQIKDMQQVAVQSVDAIEEIRKTISEINEVTVAINAAVEEQSSSTKEIARNTHEAAQGSREVSTHIIDVQKDASETGAAAQQVVAASSELGSQAEHLKSELSRFLDHFRAA